MTKDFSKNLRALCAEYGSIAQTCRDIGINRQQFNRYLNGGGMPSAHNLRRIAKHFKIGEAELMLDEASFAPLHLHGNKSNQNSLTDPISGLFENQSSMLRRYLGFYHGHFITPTWSDKLMRTLIWLRELDGKVVSHTYERALSKNQGIVQKTRYSGIAAYRGNRIYLLETANSEDGFLSTSILFPAHRQQVNYLQGMTMGVATRPRMAPYSSSTMWKKLPERTTAREALDATGIYNIGDTRIDLVVRNHFDNTQD